MKNDKFNGLVTPVTGIHQLVEKHALLKPDAPAITFNGKTLSYKALNEKSNQLAHLLIAKGVKLETLIGVSLNRSVEMVIAILGILKAGGAYVPIDAEYPKERINYMISNSDIKFLITQHLLLEQTPQSAIEKICLDTLHEQLDDFPITNPSLLVNSDNLAYVLYTSGSTGNPKGVMVCHESLIQAYAGWETIYHLNEMDCHLQMASFSFDVFSGDWIRALCSGGKLVLCPKETLLAPEMLYKLMEGEKITCAEFVPIILRRLMEHVKTKNISLKFMRVLICGSDNWSMQEYKKLQQLCGKETRIINSYGLTEATIDSTYFETKWVSKEQVALNHTVPIGKPFPSTEIFLLDDHLNIVSNGKIGEIYIGGPGVARGYINQPELTSKKFILNPFTKKSHSRLYKTGDLGRLLPDGNIEFLGRIDNQVKLRGMRIELSDIENALNCYPSVRESLVVFSEDESQHKRLAAYLLLKNDIQIDLRKLRTFLQKRLPHHMIPSVFIKLESLPMTPNGKLDRQALKGKIIFAESEHYVAPRTSLEKYVVNIWKKLLHLDKVGVLDNFYDMGGDSILLAQLLCEIEDSFLIKISACEILKNLTVADLTQRITKAMPPEKNGFKDSSLSLNALSEAPK